MGSDLDFLMPKSKHRHRGKGVVGGLGSSVAITGVSTYKWYVTSSGWVGASLWTLSCLFAGLFTRRPHGCSSTWVN
jgi:hypothetical protein